jgi:hypothetical protein
VTQSIDPVDAFAELGRIKLSETDLPGVLTRIAELAKATIPEVTEASVTLVRGGNAYTAAFTGQVALDLDERQYEDGRGPCLDAAYGGVTVAVADTTAETRWPDWAARATATGVHSSLSIGLPIQEAVVGA